MTKNANTSAPEDLKLSSYSYELPPELIAQRPVHSEGQKRDLSRLLVYNSQTDQVCHDFFYNLPNYIPQDSLLVFNQSKVFPSRLFGEKKTGGKVELFMLSVEALINNTYPTLIKTRGKKKVGDEFFFPDGLKAQIATVLNDGTFEVKLGEIPSTFNSLLDYLEAHAHIPIPPYIRKGESDETDKKSYQTLYSKHIGSVAAPTAGLHFTDNVFSNLKNKKIDTAFVTLHVGLGTFKPVTVTDLKDHQMHSENYFIDAENYEKINSGKRIFAVGTTSLRVLESAYGKKIEPSAIYQTQIFIHPGVEVKSIAGLITNFHLPESTLLMLVSALIGRKKTLELYEIAVREKYRFFSYGDAMLILK